MAKQNISGKAGHVKRNGTKINFTQWAGSLDVKLADTTDSEDYDATSELIWNTQVACSAKLQVDVEGNWDINGSQDALLTQALSGSLTIPTVELGISATEPFGYGSMNVSNFKCTTPTEDTVKFTCTLTSNGPFRPGAAP